MPPSPPPPRHTQGDEKQNVSEMAVARGYASVIRHRTDEERSCVYERLVECEELAKQVGACVCVFCLFGGVGSGAAVRGWGGVTVG